ncbi:hypothetical protein BH20VER3_BH20VER3_06580 [soil metagenome]
MRTKSFFLKLPPLPRKLPLQKGQSPIEALLDLLREIALSNQGDAPKTFYTLRAVATNFGLSLSVVSRVFSILAAEGLLGMIRGSRTVLHGRKDDRDLHVRGVVGLPASIFCFVVFADYRAFLTHARRELRRRGFMPADVFFERHEANSGFLAENLIASQADVVIWFSADRTYRETAAALRDADVRLIGVCDGGLPSIPCRYAIRRENALRRILREWRSAGVRSVALVNEPRGRSEADEEIWRSASEDERLETERVLLTGDALKRDLAKLGRKEERGILMAGSAAALTASREPAAFADLMRRRRVALVEGPVSMPFWRVPQVKVDLVTLDWKTVAARIVDDLVSQAAWETSESLVFHAEAHLRVPLNRHCHEL